MIGSAVFAFALAPNEEEVSLFTFQAITIFAILICV